MKYIALLTFIIFSGCTSQATLTKPESEQYFVLEKPYTRVQVRGLSGNNWVEGLQAGTYNLIGEDSDGRYFQGPGDCVIQLTGDWGKRYLETGEIPSFQERVGTMAGGVGGLWLPKEGVSKEPRLFYEIRNKGVGESGVGVAAVSIIQATEGSYTYVLFGSEKSFLSNIRVVKK